MLRVFFQFSAICCCFALAPDKNIKDAFNKTGESESQYRKKKLNYFGIHLKN